MRDVSEKLAVPVSLHMLLRALFERALPVLPVGRDLEVDVGVYTVGDLGLAELAFEVHNRVFAQTIPTMRRLKAVKKNAAVVGEDCGLPFGLSAPTKIDKFGEGKPPKLLDSDNESIADPEKVLSDADRFAGDSCLGEESDRGSEDADVSVAPLAPPPMPPPPMPPPPAAPSPIPNVALGIIHFEVAPSGQSGCYVCGKKIPKGSLRLQCRLKVSTSLRDVRNLHTYCAKDLKPRSPANLKKVEDFLLIPDLSSDVFATLESVADDLRGPSTASGSGAAASSAG